MQAKRLLVTLVITLLALSFHAHADVVTGWNTAALTAIRTDKTSPPATAG